MFLFYFTANAQEIVLFEEISEGITTTVQEQKVIDFNENKTTTNFVKLVRVSNEVQTLRNFSFRPLQSPKVFETINVDIPLEEEGIISTWSGNLRDGGHLVLIKSDIGVNADIVVVITNQKYAEFNSATSKSSLVLGAALQFPIPSVEAIAIVESSAIGIGTFAFQHEIGHLLGAGHHPNNIAFPQPVDCGKAHDVNGKFTIMSYDNNIILHYSNPDVTVNGGATGTNQFDFDLNTFPSGYYYIRAISSNNSINLPFFKD